MVIDTKARKKSPRDRWRFPYHFTAAQVMKMIELGIVDDSEDVELWDGMLYKMVKGELHNYIVSQVADALRAVTPNDYHVREEKSSKYGEFSLPEPDVAVARGSKADYLPEPPHLARMALLVEVSHHTRDADEGQKLRRYAEVGVPVYWILYAKRREVRVYSQPQGGGELARYDECAAFTQGDDIPIVVDGQEVGRVAATSLFPPERTP